jgi:3-hydroxyacyl-CoA dehydrogenase
MRSSRATKHKFDEGLALEREIFTNLMFTPECKAHCAICSWPSARVQDSGRAGRHAAREIKSVAVIGAGTMGGGISMNFLNAGIPVKMLEMKQEALDRGLGTIRKNYESQVKRASSSRTSTSSAWRC